MQQFKKLRNKVNSNVRADTIKFNNEIINKANSQKETWAIINEVSNPKSQNNWTLKTEQGETSDHGEIAEILNVYFNKKIVDLKNNIDPELKEDPIKKMQENTDKLKKSCKFDLKTTYEQELNLALKKMKSKKSACVDGISQEILVQGAECMLTPLLDIVNTPISAGTFPTSWKEGLVTHVLKKGDPKCVENYRPVSCLPAASKLFEMIICNQTTKYYGCSQYYKKATDHTHYYIAS